jgi:putative nicotinate-nucleotide diphosphorylase (carboxylating)
MVNYEFSSIFAPYILKFIGAKETMGFSRIYFEKIFKLFDLFFIEERVSTPFITHALITKWSETQVNNRDSTIYSKYSVMAQFSKYMNQLGFSCYVPRLPKRKYNTYIPYIFTKEQVQSLFAACDSLTAYDKGNMDSRLFSIPCVFRLLYSTGMRVSEATSLLNRNVDFERQLIIIRKTKNQQQRLIPINLSLCQVLHQYQYARNRLPLPNTADKDAPFFISPSGLVLTQSRIYEWFRKTLRICGISHCTGKGPRVHDLCHTCAVHSLINQVKNGADIYCVLPILSVFLGHKKLSDTETYVRLTREMFPDILEQEHAISQFLFPALPNKLIQYEE